MPSDVLIVNLARGLTTGHALLSSALAYFRRDD
jgi:hypothetical protein